MVRKSQSEEGSIIRLLENFELRRAQWWNAEYERLSIVGRSAVDKRVKQLEHDKLLTIRRKKEEDLQHLIEEPDHLCNVLAGVSAVWINSGDDSDISFELDGASIHINAADFFARPRTVAGVIFTFTSRVCSTEDLNAETWNRFVGRFVRERIQITKQEISEDELILKSVLNILYSMDVVGTFKQYTPGKKVTRDNTVAVYPHDILRDLQRIHPAMNLRQLRRATEKTRIGDSVSRIVGNGSSVRFWQFPENILPKDTPDPAGQRKFNGDNDD